MHPAIYCLLLAGVARAHYRSYDPRNLIERVPEIDAYGSVNITCPVCANSSPDPWKPPYNENCLLDNQGQSYKRCRFGTYFNEKCRQLDCYRGEEEDCTEKRIVDYYDLRCAPGLYCHPLIGKCSVYLDSNLPRIIFKQRASPLNDPYNINFSVRRQRTLA